MAGSSYKIDSKRGVLYATVSGQICLDALRVHVEELFADARFTPDLRGLIDVRCMTGPLPSMDELRELARALRPILLLPVQRRCAIIVRRDELLDRAYLFEALTAHTFVQFRAFYDTRLAHAWLGVECRTEIARPTPPAL
jgi:hypothetical protein